MSTEDDCLGDKKAQSKSLDTLLDNVRVLAVFGATWIYGQERANVEVLRTVKELGGNVKCITHSKWGYEFVQPELTRLNIGWSKASFGPLIGKNIVGLDVIRIVIGLISTSLALLKDIHHYKPTHIYIMNWQYCMYVLPALILTKLPLIYRSGDCPPCQTSIHRWLWRQICHRTSYMVCVSGFVRKHVLNDLKTPLKSTVIYSSPPRRSLSHPASIKDANNFVAFDEAIEENSGSNIFINTPNEAIKIVYAGQITEHKGVPVLVEAIRILLGQNKNISLWLAGNYTYNNQMAERLIREIKQDKLEDKIQFLGYIDDIPALISLADIHVCPSIWDDPMPNVIMEAKEQGVPSVVFPKGGMPEVIEHLVDGYICEDIKAESLAQGIEYFLIYPDKLKTARVAARRSLLEKYGTESFKREWGRIFLNTIVQ